MIILLVICGLIILTNLSLILHFKFNFKSHDEHSEAFEWPLVSILVAARNEEKHLENCIQTLLELDYPKQKIQILIGNDDSEDDTQKIIDKLSLQDSRITSVKIESGYQKLIAKSNVIAQLAKVAKGEFLAIIDADNTVSKLWLQGMVKPMLGGADLVSGYTVVKVNSWLDRMQAVDWIGTLFLMKVAADFGFPVSALGNNMMLRKSTYESMGGFEALGPTKIEDLKMVIAFRKARHKHVQILGESCQATTEPMKSVKDLLIQRKRWLSGILKYNPFLGIILIFERLTILAVIIAFLNSIITLGLQSQEVAWLGTAMLLMLSFELAKVDKVVVKLKGNLRPLSIMVDQIFIALLNTFALLSLIVSPKVIWKNRRK
jgi:cellulose synthase/poly-beta-1,6-N-acetylglucosamine synthase-like glycosyltransferase